MALGTLGWRVGSSETSPCPPGAWEPGTGNFEVALAGAEFVVGAWRASEPAAMGRKPTPTGKGAQKLGERERGIGLVPDDEAAKWLREHDPPPEPRTPKAATKSKVLHRWRRRQQRG